MSPHAAPEEAPALVAAGIFLSTAGARVVAEMLQTGVVIEWIPSMDSNGGFRVKGPAPLKPGTARVRRVFLRLRLGTAE